MLVNERKLVNLEGKHLRNTKEVDVVEQDVSLGVLATKDDHVAGVVGGLRGGRCAFVDVSQSQIGLQLVEHVSRWRLVHDG